MSTIHELSHENMMDIVRGYAKKIALLARRGDPLSVKTMKAYEFLYDHVQSPEAHYEFRQIFCDWMKQHLEVTSRLELARKFGYLVDGEDPNVTRKIVTLQ